MQVSAEVRWFRQGPPSPEVVAWFERSTMKVVGFSARPDEYARNTSAELGVKKRGTKPGVEIKTLVARQQVALAAGSIDFEFWVKTSWDAFGVNTVPKVLLEKKRRLRKFAFAGGSVTEIQMKDGTEETADGTKPTVGCNVELTTVSVEGAVWCTIGAESFAGPTDSIETLRDALLETLDGLRLDDARLLSEWKAQSYASWLARFATT